MSIKAILERFAGNVSVREAGPEDAPVVCALYACLAAEETGVEFDREQARRVMKWTLENLASQNITPILAEIKGKVVGQVIAAVIQSAPENAYGTLSVFGRYVLPEARASLVGQALMRACYKLAEDTGCERVAFQLVPGRRTGLYERLGCHKTAEIYEGSI